jgi:hypothetical protein
MVLVIMYSYTGTCRRLAALLCSQQGWPMAEIFDARPRTGMFGIWRCLLDSWLRREPAIRYLGPSPEDFDAVVLVAPIWAHQLAGPMRSFVAARRASLPDVAVAPVMGGRDAPDAIAEVGQLIGRAPILSTAFSAREIHDGSCAARLQAFGDGIRRTCAGLGARS